jgi:hypothetical protein
MEMLMVVQRLTMPTSTFAVVEAEEFVLVTEPDLEIAVEVKGTLPHSSYRQSSSRRL